MSGRVAYFEYEPRAWQAKALAELEEKRWSVVVAHRRSGKTEVMCLRLILAALQTQRAHPQPSFAYVAPFLKQAKAVAWGRLKYYLRQLPDVKINESELTAVLPGGSLIGIYGADYPDRLRGLGFDGVVMDEVAQMKPDTWAAVVRPALADRGGWATFIGTPKGLGTFYELYQNAIQKEDWYCLTLPATITNIIPEEELRITREQQGEVLFRQEFLCDFTADSIGVFMRFDPIEQACRTMPEPSNEQPLVFGLDVARFGDDKTVLLERKGRVITKITAWAGADLMATASEVANIAMLRRPRAIFVDSVGLGAGVVDRLKQMGMPNVYGVNSGVKAKNPEKFRNLKAELWSKMRDWFDEGAQLGALSEDQHMDLKAELLAPMYDFDTNGRLKIESKADLKARGLSSPDMADALALTFAMPVVPDDIRRAYRHNKPRFAEMD